MTDLHFKLPPGYVSWCHLCGEHPLNKTTEVVINGVKLTLKGVGFKRFDDATKHKRDVHQIWKG